MKILMAQLNYILGDFKHNSAKIIDIIQKYGNDTDLIVFSELAVSGYYPYDFIDRYGFVDTQDEYLAQIRLKTRNLRAAVMIGHIGRNGFIGKRYHNSLSVFENGESIFTYDKMLLCDYNIFNELRHNEPGNRPGTFLFHGKRVGVLICEDSWNDHNKPLYGVDPVDRLSREKLDLVISINGSPSNVGKQKQRFQVIGNVAKRCNAPIIYVNQVGGYDDIVFDGGSFAVTKTGMPLYALPSFTEAAGIVELHGTGALSSDGHSTSLTRDPKPLDDTDLIYRQAVIGIRDYVEKCGFTGVVVGSSGGIDSAVTLALSVAALGPDRVTAITMPSRYSSAGSVDDSVALCRNLGIRLYTAPIEEEFTAEVATFEKAFEKAPDRLTRENMQARLRGVKLMAFSNDNPGVLVLSTGNKSEMSTGYATLYGDMNGGINPLGDIYKMQVYAVGKLYNEKFTAAAIPDEIFTKAPSAELSEGQKDSDSLPEYPVLDAILKLYIEHDLMTEEERQENIKILAMTSSSVIGRVIQLVDRAEYKRKQAPPIIRVQRRSFGSGRQMPISGRFYDERFVLNLLGRVNNGLS